MKEKIHIWLDKVEREAVVPTEVIALNFGLYETDKGYCIYLVGARGYEENNDSWAEDVEYLPHEFFLEIETQCDWKEFQEQIVNILANEIKYRRTNFISPFHHKIITVGFDDGNLIKIT